MNVVAMIQPTETREVEAEGSDYEAAREAAKALVPDGWRIVSFRAVK